MARSPALPTLSPLPAPRRQDEAPAVGPVGKHQMAKISFSVDSNLAAETVLAVARDFSELRPHYWPNIDPKVYKVHSLTATSADVTEGSAAMGGIWGLEAYDLSQPGTVQATLQDSNIFQPGGVWRLCATPRADGGCHIEVLNHRQARGFKGHVLGAMLTVMGRRAFAQSLQKTLDIIASEARAGTATAAAAAV